ncbi:hypothetical protein CC1G_06624 [Coprinopsis cinerea okayama7|uniref:Homeobox domain-containing protein n=1 Tax=Coprinopsis cinerea (strain Okayama-7 / 130 / ATCC MYA-4618 / FGSC 9003) TaxID=240176 RepID=A8N329_COPC7|nr:hypothetical protein CC1G_06624 [Coprinopsis cinerea okayama7\|eukprot:XP_001829287.1 hypothetical protein CC1G_06624 [Coprinopsis cinerea okayama7\
MSLATVLADEWANTVAPTNPATANGAQKKPRHRHAPEQLAALNELFEKDEHPPLDIRSALAERLGMETKTVNAWFQNKRASSKKRTRTVASDRANGSHLNSTNPNAPAAANPPVVPTTSGDRDPANDNDDDEYRPSSQHTQASAQSKPVHSDIVQSSGLSTFVAHTDYSQAALERDESPESNMPKKMRMRPTNEQTEELKKLYNSNPHPTAEERQALAERIGMRYQSITNWFQNQRSLAKRRKDDEPVESSSSSRTDYPHNDTRQYSAFPPPPPHHMHPSLTSSSNTTALPLTANSHGSGKSQRSPSLPPSDEVSPRRTSRRSATPYSSAMSTRPRRSRPEPYQLDALKVLFTRTATPTIEERSALAQEIGMDVGKVTNWFRNLRQTARKRGSRFNDPDHEGGASGLDEDDADMDQDDFSSPNSGSRPTSRNGTPPLSETRSSSSSSLERDVRTRNLRDPSQSTLPSDDEDYSEAITPEPGNSPSPAPGARNKFEGRELPPPHTMREEPYHPLTYPYHYSQHPYAPPPPPPHPHYYPRPPMDLSRKHLMDPVVEGPVDLAFRHFNPSIAIFDPSYHPASQSYYVNEDPAYCAERAKRHGINIEDAYLLLDFHRQ